MQQNFAIATNV